MEQLDFFSNVQQALTVAEIDEWTENLRAVTDPHVASHWPHEWAREGLGVLLGEDIPHRRWSTRELLDALGRARSVAVEREADR